MNKSAITMEAEITRVLAALAAWLDVANAQGYSGPEFTAYDVQNVTDRAMLELLVKGGHLTATERGEDDDGETVEYRLAVLPVAVGTERKAIVRVLAALEAAPQPVPVTPEMVEAARSATVAHGRVRLTQEAFRRGAENIRTALTIGSTVSIPSSVADMLPADRREVFRRALRDLSLCLDEMGREANAAVDGAREDERDAWAALTGGKL